MDHIHTFLSTQGHGEPPRMSDHPNARATSETAQTWKTIHTKHTLSHPNKANMEWWIRRPNDSREPWGPKVSWYLSDRWGKAPKKKPHPGNLSRPGIEPGPAAWQARMLPLAPQRWTIYIAVEENPGKTSTEMGRTCGTYGVIQKCMHSFSGKTWGKETFREIET